MKTKPKSKKQPPKKPTTLGSLELISASCDAKIQTFQDPITGFDAAWKAYPPEIDFKTLLRLDFSTVGAVIVNGTRFVNFNPKTT